MTRLDRRAALGAVVLAAAALAGCTATAAPAPTPTPTRATSGAHASSRDIAVGDCLDDAAAGSTTATAAIVPCSEPHDSEAFAEVTLSGDSYPGLDAVQAESQTACQGDAFANFVGIAAADSSLQVSYYYPTEDSWAAGDRTVTCTVYALDASGKAARTTGTLKDSGR
ncbi:septum formation family protein [Pseudolysinimonas sp.]|uniref:septum formation family protein n=1 Tax=Pseudolysinimonas sp. TaxID=2680009 RepID=UPI003F7F6D27